MTIAYLKIVCEKFLPPTAAKFVKVQVVNTLNSQHSNGRRYSDEYKRFALQLYFISPKAYRFVKKTFTLPSVRTLQRFTHSMDFKLGCLDLVFEGLKIKVDRMIPQQRFCTLCWDEMNNKNYWIGQNYWICWHRLWKIIYPSAKSHCIYGSTFVVQLETTICILLFSVIFTKY